MHVSEFAPDRVMTHLDLKQVIKECSGSVFALWVIRTRKAFEFWTERKTRICQPVQAVRLCLCPSEVKRSEKSKIVSADMNWQGSNDLI